MKPPFILIIEDDDKNRKLAKDILEHQSYDVVAVASAEEGLAIVLNRSPDLILLDIQLPGMSGLEAIRQLRSIPAVGDVAVIAFTASVMPADQQRVLDAGFDALLPKPIALKAFLATVQRLILRREAE